MWSPFQNAVSFTNQGQDFGLAGGQGNYALSPWWALLYFAGWAAALMAIALYSASKRDA
jgi:ABC-2 type transport system permease protein